MDRKIGPVSPQEQQAAFDRARKYMEQIIPIFRGAHPYDEEMALEYLIARAAVKMGRKPEEVIAVMKHNLPLQMAMWEQAFNDVTSGMTLPPASG